MPRFQQRKRHCAKEENKRALKRDTCLCLGLPIARALVLTIAKLAIKLFYCNALKGYITQRKRMPRLLAKRISKGQRRVEDRRLDNNPPAQ